ncbi:DUF1697 domain-containing protein [Candidatus Saccharibacteria bacterium]|nr:DUF1697 domain-containing protein [Candidatus Saccharibacteria bacterium]
MKYVVLLRGINVGGNNKVSMSDLKQALQDAGFTDVVTYINSGNIVLTSELPTKAVNNTVEETIKQTFGLDVPTLTLAKPDFLRIADELPTNWTNDSEMRCDCFFLWQGIDTPDVLENLTIKPDIDRVKYVAGAVFWSVDRKNVTRSGLAKIIGTATYKQITIRNANTVRKLVALLA